MTLTISTADIAAALGVEPGTAARKVRRLIDEHGFPRPIPGSPSRFSHAAVAAWFARQGLPEAAREPTRAPNATGLDVARAKLEAVYSRVSEVAHG